MVILTKSCRAGRARHLLSVPKSCRAGSYPTHRVAATESSRWMARFNLRRVGSYPTRSSINRNECRHGSVLVVVLGVVARVGQ